MKRNIETKDMKENDVFRLYIFLYNYDDGR